MEMEEFAIWKEWQELAFAFQTVKDTIPNCDKRTRMPFLIKETQDKLKQLFKRTIIDVLSEIIICDVNVDALEIFKGGISLLSLGDSCYCSDYHTRYRIPNEIFNILNTGDDYSVLTYELIDEVLKEFRNENINGSSYLEYCA